MPATAKLYGQMLVKALNKEISITADTIKIMLCTSAYVPNQDTHVYLSSVTSEVANGNGYTTGGKALANKAVTYDSATNTIKIDADDVQWNNATMTARYAVIYDDTPATSATKPLLAYFDFGQDVSSTNGTFKLAFDATNGICTFTAS